MNTIITLCCVHTGPPYTPTRMVQTSLLEMTREKQVRQKSVELADITSIAALHLAIRHKYARISTDDWDHVFISFPKLVDILLNNGADIQETDNEQNSPLHKVCPMTIRASM